MLPPSHRSRPGAVHYQYGAAYGAHKAGLDKFAADMAVDFRPFGVAAVSIWMGAVLTERLRQIIDSGPEYAHLDYIAETPPEDVQYLKDRQAILDVIMRHARGHDRHDCELMNSCFWDDGVDEHGQFVTPGPEYGEWANKVHTAGYLLHMHNITNHTCEIDGDTAHCESYVIGAMLPRSVPGRAKFVSGRYLDRLERRDGQWRILVRRTTIEVEVEGDAKWPENEISKTFPKGAWDTADLSYARPLQRDSPSVHWDGETR